MEQEVFLENDFISRNRFDCSWRAMSFPRIVRIVPPPALSCSLDIKSQSWTKFSRFRLGAIPGNEVIFLDFLGAEIAKIWFDFAILYQKNVIT